MSEPVPALDTETEVLVLRSSLGNTMATLRVPSAWISVDKGQLMFREDISFEFSRSGHAFSIGYRGVSYTLDKMYHLAQGETLVFRKTVVPK